jgi:hypothetical protein
MRFVLALVIGGGVLLYFGVQEFRLSSATKAEPQAITCAELAANGPGENAHVVMGDFLLCSFAFVYEEKNNKWSKVWVPAVPLGGEFHRQLLSMVDAEGNLTGEPTLPTDVKVIVKTSDVSNGDELGSMGEKDTLQGVVINNIESLGSEEKKILKESYPTVNFDECWILEVGRKPATMAKIAGLCGGGLALALSGIVLALRGRSQGAPSESDSDPSVTG